MRMRMFPIALMMVLAVASSGARQAIRPPTQDGPLKSKWAWATDEINRRAPCWIGYSIVKKMRVHSFTGSVYSEASRNKPSLCEELQLQLCPDDLPFRGSNWTHFDDDGTSVSTSGNAPEKLVDKEIAFLFRYDRQAGDAPSLLEVRVSNISLHVDLDKLPVIWLGGAAPDESVDLVVGLFNKGTDHAKKEIIDAIGTHPASPALIRFFHGVLTDEPLNQVREQAAFWLGEMAGREALPALSKAARTDKSSQVREQAVFAATLVNDPATIDTLVSLARTGAGRDTRERAMFWIGQQASKKAMATLSDIAEHDENTEVQKQALYALSQMSEDNGIDDLIRIAKTHRNKEIRKQAIYLLSEAGSERALSALIEIVKN